jgi:hypothetical protein
MMTLELRAQLLAQKTRTESHMAGGNTLALLFLRPGDDRRFEKT